MLISDYQDYFISSISLCPIDQFQLMYKDEKTKTYNTYKGSDVEMDKSFNIKIDTSQAMSQTLYIAGNHLGSNVISYF